MSGPMKDWDAMGSDWRGQAVPTIDVEALRAEATQQGRRLRVMLVLETLLSAFLVVFLCWAAFVIETTALLRWLWVGLAVSLIPYQAYVLWLRRREWSEAGLEVDALLDVEERRCRTTLHYWRFGMGAILGMWLLIYVGLWLGMRWQWPTEEVGSFVAMLVSWLIMFPLVGVYGLHRCSLARARLRRLAVLREQLRAP